MINNSWLVSAVLLVVFIASSTCAIELSFKRAAAPASAGPMCTRYTSAALVGDIDLSKVTPKPVNCPLGCNLYTVSGSALGFNGPLGALGPLGPLGPVSSGTPWNVPDNFVWYGNNFNTYLKEMNACDKLLSHPQNPLSSAGPMGDAFYDVMPKINDFTKHMMGMGVWTVLGPLGPLGPLGALGPLGPVGCHMLDVDKDGQFVTKKGDVLRVAPVVYNSSLTVNWPLFERYKSKEFVDKLSKKGLLDTSFMVTTNVDTTGHSYEMTVTEPQYVTVATIPSLWAKNFFLEAFINGKSVFKSEKLFFTPWFQVHLSGQDIQNAGPGGAKLKVVVKADPLNCGVMSVFGCTMEYTMHVIGSTSFMMRKPHISYTGPHIKQCA